MRHWMIWMVVTVIGLGAWFGLAHADYGRRVPQKSAASSEDSFEQMMDLNRVRKGNFEWDTQKLIADGFTALHREHVQILEEMIDIKSRLKELEEAHTGDAP